MALILNIETSTNVCSAAISRNGEVIDLLENFEGQSHASLLTVFIEKLFKQNSLQFSDLDAVSISEGPGSYTGLRIGVSVAKGICYAQNKPLIAINTLKAMAMMAKETISDISQNALFCPMIDARRMEVYSALFDTDLNNYRKTIAEVIEENAYQEELINKPIYFFGDGANKCTDKIIHKNAIFNKDIYPSAKYMARLSQIAFEKNDFKDVAYFEPFYLKDFVATTPKKKVL